MPTQPTLRRSHAIRNARTRRGGYRVQYPTVGQCFDIEVSRSNDGWMVRIPEIGEVAYASRRNAVELAARTCIASRTGIPIGYVAVFVTSENG
jgi:hypothetical protein